MVPEPFGFDGPNLYHYVFGEPVRHVDRYGLESYLPGWNPYYDDITLYDRDKKALWFLAGLVFSWLAIIEVIDALDQPYSDNYTYEIEPRGERGRDGGESFFIRERGPDGDTLSTTHVVGRDGEIVHRHREYPPKDGGEGRPFPDEWTNCPRI